MGRESSRIYINFFIDRLGGALRDQVLDALLMVFSEIISM
jgi:hypothetical protein